MTATAILQDWELTTVGTFSDGVDLLALALGVVGQAFTDAVAEWIVAR